MDHFDQSYVLIQPIRKGKGPKNTFLGNFPLEGEGWGGSGVPKPRKMCFLAIKSDSVGEKWQKVS